ncbi:anti-repressor SinI family protein [Schinkia sp. CFF1]
MDIQSVQSSNVQDISLPKIDSEWLQLLLEAKAIGLSVEDIRAFLRKNDDSYVLREKEHFKPSN